MVEDIPPACYRMCRLSWNCKIQVKTIMTRIELGVVLTLWSCNSDGDGLPIIKFWKGRNIQKASRFRKVSILLESRFLSETSQHVVMRFWPTSWHRSSRSSLSLSLPALLLIRMPRLLLHKINWDKNENHSSFMQSMMQRWSQRKWNQRQTTRNATGIIKAKLSNADFKGNQTTGAGKLVFLDHFFCKTTKNSANEILLKSLTFLLFFSYLFIWN